MRRWVLFSLTCDLRCSWRTMVARAPWLFLAFAIALPCFRIPQRYSVLAPVEGRRSVEAVGPLRRALQGPLLLLIARSRTLSGPAAAEKRNGKKNRRSVREHTVNPHSAFDIRRGTTGFVENDDNLLFSTYVSVTNVPHSRAVADLARDIVMRSIRGKNDDSRLMNVIPQPRLL